MTHLVCCVDFGSTFTKAALVDVGEGRLVGTASHPTTLDTDVLDGWEACRDRLADLRPGARDAEVLACSSAGGGLRIGVVGNEELVTAEAGRRVALSSGGRVVHVAAASPDVGGGGATDALARGGPGPMGLARGHPVPTAGHPVPTAGHPVPTAGHPVPTTGHPVPTAGHALDEAAVTALRDAAPDVVLLVGGTDGGNVEVLLGCAKALAVADWSGPVVVAGNVDAQGEVAAMFTSAGVPHVCAANVVPRIGVLTPDSARAAIRAMFLEHVIGGKDLSRRADFTAMVRGATPDVVLTAVELLGESAGDVVVVDIGGATTDVHSVVELDPEDAGLARQVVAPMPVSRTVEGDLGMRWSAVDTVRAGREAGLVGEGQYDGLAAAARIRRTRPSYLADNETETALDEHLAAVAAGVALRRHAGRQQVRFGPDGRVVERTGKDLRAVDLLVGSGGVLRHNSPELAVRVLSRGTGHDIEGGWLLPESPRVVVDREYVLAACGLLAAEHPAAARRLLERLIEESR